MIHTHMRVAHRCVCVCGVYATTCVWRSEDNFIELVLSFHLCVGFRNLTPVIRLEKSPPLKPAES